MKITCITGNDHKLQELASLLPGIKLVQASLDLVEIQDSNPMKVIEAKVVEARCHFPDVPFIVEDTSLHMECMGGLPGPFIKWHLQGDGLNNLATLAISTSKPRASARTIIALCYPLRPFVFFEPSPFVFFEGVLEGKIVPPHGDGYGWSKIFIPTGHDKRFSEMSLDERNACSMRAIAARKLGTFLVDNSNIV